MTTPLDWHWAMSNAGSTKVLLWLEPWADEVEVPVGGTATLRILNASNQFDSLDVEETGEHVVIWAADGDCLEVYIDGVLQPTGSASIPVPEGLTKNLLGVVFANQPEAHLAGRRSRIEAPAFWRRIRSWISS
jgi:hypothetical protein